jgi:hypothetical protein
MSVIDGTGLVLCLVLWLLPLSYSDPHSAIMDLHHAQIRSQSLRIAHYNLVCTALHSKIRRFACVFMRILEP